MKPDMLTRMHFKDSAQAAIEGGPVGTLVTNKAEYTASLTDLSRPREELMRDPDLRGEEMLDMDVLLPRRKEGGKLFRGTSDFVLIGML